MMASNLAISVRTVISPFSFFCVVEENQPYKNAKDDIRLENNACEIAKKIEFSDTNHGQYVAVLWNNKWARGIVSMESQFLIWLVDHGIYMRPNESTVYVNLPAEYKKFPSKVFEASIHGVTPIGITLDELYEFKNEPKLSWSLGTIEKVQEIIAAAAKTYFAPIAILTTKTNDVVLGDLYLEYKDKRFVNLIDEMDNSPTFMERNKEIYIENLSNYYMSGRHHRACLLRPELPLKNLPTISFDTTIVEYSVICAQITHYSQEFDSDSEDGSSVTYIEKEADETGQNDLKLTPQEIEEYSNEFIYIGGRMCNVLTILINKARDLYYCEKDIHAKSVGRANTRLRRAL